MNFQNSSQWETNAVCSEVLFSWWALLEKPQIYATTDMNKSQIPWENKACGTSSAHSFQTSSSICGQRKEPGIRSKTRGPLIFLKVTRDEGRQMLRTKEW